jgi:hypothetical protein
MFELLQNFEHAAVRFSPVFLFGLGIPALLAGLFIWLGGLGLAKILSGAAGAVTGAICGLFVVRQNIPSAVFIAIVLAAFAVIFDRIFFIFLTAALAAVLSFTVLAWPYLGNPQPAPSYQDSISGQVPAMSADQTVEVAKTYLINLNSKLKQVRSRMPPYNWVLITALTLIVLFSAFYFWRLTSAVSCAILGTMLIFGGMVLLLLYKGSAPISNICYKAPYYGGVFLVMTVFGLVVQLLLCRQAKKRSTRKKEANKDKDRDGEEPWETRQSWRTI